MTYIFYILIISLEHSQTWQFFRFEHYALDLFCNRNIYKYLIILYLYIFLNHINIYTPYNEISKI